MYFFEDVTKICKINKIKVFENSSLYLEKIVNYLNLDTLPNIRIHFEYLNSNYNSQINLKNCILETESYENTNTSIRQLIIFNFSGAFMYGGEGGVMIDGVLYEGAGITAKAFDQYIPGSEYFLTTAVVLFAISTMISWSYYGIQSWKYLFGKGKVADMVYKLMFLAFIVIGSAASMNSIWAFSDAMIFAMVFPNMIGLYFLFPVVREQLNKYLSVIKEAKV